MSLVSAALLSFLLGTGCYLLGKKYRNKTIEVVYTEIGKGIVSKKLMVHAPKTFIGSSFSTALDDQKFNNYYRIKLSNGAKIDTENYQGTTGSEVTIYQHEDHYADHEEGHIKDISMDTTINVIDIMTIIWFAMGLRALSRLCGQDE